MRIETTPLHDVLIVTNDRFGDDRGWFSEVYRDSEFKKAANPAVNFVQMNESFSQKGILRGIHYQKPHPQGKLVRVVRGEVFDVAVDLRKSSPTFGKWFGILLSENNGRQLWIPEGFGHGFYVTGECAHFVYSCTDYYDKKSEHCIVYSDPDLDITWPLVDGKDPIVSPKDLQGKLFKDAALFD